LAILEGRSKQALKQWLQQQSESFRDGVEIVAMDGFTGYKSATVETIDDVTTVMDPFHVVALAGEKLDRCRQRLQQETLGHRGRSQDPLYGIRRIARTRAALLTKKQWFRLLNVFDQDCHTPFAVSWEAYQRVIDAYQADQPAEGKKIMTRLITRLQSSVPTGLEELRSLGHTMKRRRDDILAFFDHPGGVERPNRGRQRPAGAPPRDSSRVPQHQQLHRSLPTRRGRVQTPDPLSSVKSRMSVAAAVGGFLFGFDSSVINGAVDSIQGDFALSKAAVGLVVAIALLACAVGAVLAGTLSDRWGRLKVMLLGAVLFFLSSIGAALASTVTLLVLWRIIGGLGIGIASVVAPAYIAEVAPRQIRGALASLQQLAITLGIFVALMSDFSLESAAGGADQVLWFGMEAWRWMFLVGAIPALVYGLLAFTLPESPRYLLAQGQVAQAREVFFRLVPPADLEYTMRELTHSIESEREKRTVSLRGPVLGLHGVVWVGIILSVLQQFVGINVIFYYSTSLWSSVGFTDASLISVYTAVTNVVVTLVAIALVDRLGRRPILLTGSVLMAVSLGLMALSFSFATTDAAGEVVLGAPWGPVALVAANVFVVGFGASWGPLVWVLLGEIFPSRIRGKALGVAAGAQWVANFLITVTFPSMSAWSLPVTYGFYSVMAACSFLFVWWKIPETKGMELEQAETLFSRAASK